MFSNRFRATKKLRSGPDIETFSGTDARDGAEVLIMAARRAALVEGAEARLAYEVAVLNRLDGAGSPGPIHFDSDGDAVFLVRRFIRGMTLEERLGKHDALNAVEAVELALGLAGTLERVHAAGVLHRAIKPSNIILPADG